VSPLRVPRVISKKGISVTKNSYKLTRLFLFGWVVVGLGAMRYLYQLVLEVRALDRASPFLTNRVFAWLLIFLLLSLLLVAVGLALRSRIGLGCSIIGLTGVLVGYVGWYHYSNDTLKMLRNESIFPWHPEILPPYSFGLIKGHWWDIALLIMFVSLFMWEIKVLLKASADTPARGRS
jgi:hypothetical protein